MATQKEVTGNMASFIRNEFDFEEYRLTLRLMGGTDAQITRAIREMKHRLGKIWSRSL